MNIKVKGGQILNGEIFPSGSKNSAVHLIPCSLLFREKIVLENVPDITDVGRLVNILKRLGSSLVWNSQKSILEVDNSKISFESLTQEDLGNMKGSSLLWGALLSRFGKVDFRDLPGGCTLGIRPLEPIYKVFRDLGVVVTQKNGGVVMSSEKAESGEVWLTEMSPTATTNLIMLATSLSGRTRIVGAASEPQVQDVCNFLTEAGADIKGIGSSVLEINGGKKLKGINYKILSDHYEIATFLALGALTGGEVRVHNAIPEHFKIINHEFAKFNIDVKYDKDTAYVSRNQKVLLKGSFGDKTLIVRAQPWPALPVDLLPIFIPLALSSPGGYMMFHNWMYESGLFWTSELTKLGAEVIMADPHRVMIVAGNKLKGAVLEAPFIIRAVVSMVMAAMIAQGETTILNADSLYRGHPHFAENLRRLGAKIDEIA